MDARIYGSYHGRFSPTRHPANTAWASAPDGLAWLLGLTWDEFDSFNRAALPEYLDLLAEDLDAIELKGALLVDGGLCTPGLLPSHLCKTGRETVLRVLEEEGFKVVVMSPEETAHGSVESLTEAQKYADLFKKNRDAIDGVPVSYTHLKLPTNREV